MQARTVVVLGAGPGGSAAAHHLRRYLPDSSRVVVVDRTDRLTLGISHLLIMRGWLDADAASVSVRGSLPEGVEFVQAEVQGIDPGARRVRTSTGEIAYDALLVALGADLRADLVPGLKKALDANAVEEFYSLPGASRLRRRLESFSGGRVCVVISRLPYKCPPAPYEAALLIADRLRERGVETGVQIDLFTPEPSPIAAGGPEMGQAIRSTLQERGITLHTGEELSAVDHEQRSATFASGREESWDLLVAVPPHAAPRVLVESGLIERGWLIADRHTLRTAFEGIWAIGDASAVPMANGMPLPKAAVFATAEAEAAARDIARTLGATAPEPAFEGVGRCWFIVADGMAGYIEGRFLDPPGPKLQLHPASADNFAAMQAELRAWKEQARQA
ncbi:FAD/NAD(P)-binding oxidoreductase [Sphaerobacter sp.]|uniref:NAD(P)/FAD-dependent oxidoreductase n=1 Tax=Sphaerobacter sp. TaxID=2099654 RepID=UPI001D711A68|nr:FAD/NAD(P)-binding oxidoreductase [Sphaerobacter sp.]MBX5445606.1 NAD(P)/FAD-dependent oxidoreductase [Sphaerobacter sp.]